MITESLLGTDFLIKNAKEIQVVIDNNATEIEKLDQEIGCLLYTSPSPRD